MTIDWDAAISSVRSANASAAQSLTSDTSPDDAARAFQLSQSTGVPAEHIGNDLDGFEERHKKALGQSIISNNGYIADFVNTHPLHGPLISDDLGNLDRLSRAYQKLVTKDPIENFSKGFKEGFGQQGFGDWQSRVGPEWQNLSQKYPISSQLWTMLGFPFEFGGRFAKATIAGAHKAIVGWRGEKAANDLAGMLEYELMKPETRAFVQPGKTEFEYPAEGEVLGPEAKPPGRGLPPKGPETIEGEAVDLGRRDFLKGVGATGAAAAMPKGVLSGPLETLATETNPFAGAPLLDPAHNFAAQYIYSFHGDRALAKEHLMELAKDAGPTMQPIYNRAVGLVDSVAEIINPIYHETQALKPWLEAGEEPPSNVSQVADQAKEQVAKLDQDAIKSALDDANSTALKDRAPDKFAEFLDGHPDGIIAIEKEAIAKNPAAFDWIPNLEAELARPLSKIEVSAKDFLLNFDKELWPEFKDFISRGGPTVNEAKEIMAFHANPLEAPRPKLRLVKGISDADVEDSIVPGLEKFERPNVRIATADEVAQLRPDMRQRLNFPYYIIDDAGHLAGYATEAEAKDALPKQNVERPAPEPPSSADLLAATRRFHFGAGTIGDERLLRQAGLRDLGDIGGVPKVSGNIIGTATETPSPANDPMLRQVLQRSKSGRPMRTAPMGDTDKLVEGIRRAAGLEPLRITDGLTEPPSRPPPTKPLSEPPSGEPAKPPLPFTDAKAFGRTKPEYKKYLDLIAQQSEEMRQYLEKRALRQAERENSVAWKTERAALEPEVRNEVSTRPEIAAWNFFENGEAFGSKLERRPKLDRAALTEEQFDALPASWIRDGGLHPDAVANMFGYSHGSDLVDALAAVARETEGQKGSIIDRLVNAELDRRLNDKLGEDAAERLENAKDHALSTTTMEMLHEQVLALGTRLGVELPLDKARMDWGAREILKEQRFGGLSSTKLLSEAAKAVRLLEKALLGDDPTEAFKAAQYHYTVTQMAKEMLAVEKETKAFAKIAKKYWKRFTPDDRAPIPTEYVNWVQDVLLRTVQGRAPMRSAQDLANAIKAEDLTSLRDFVINKQYFGRDIPVPDFLQDSSFRKPLESMTVDQARQTMFAVQQLVKNGREERKIISKGNKEDFADFVTKANQQVADAAGGKMAPDDLAAAHRLVQQYYASGLQIPTLLNRFDMGNPYGLFQSFALRRLLDSQGTEFRLDKAVGQAFKAIKYQGNLKESVPNPLFRKPIEAWNGATKSFDWAKANLYEFTRAHLLAVMHNLGNTDNLVRLAEGYGLEPKQVWDWAVAVAKPEDWRYVSEFGKVIFEHLRGPRNDMYKRAYDVTPKDIDLTPIDTPIGRLDGWYHPVIHDPNFPGFEKPKGKTLFPDEYVFAGTPNGYTKERTNYRGPISLNLNLVASRIKQEIHDVSWRETVIDVSKLFRDRSFQATVTKHFGQPWASELDTFVDRIAHIGTYNDANADAIEKALDAFRVNVIGNIIGLNPRTVQKHGTTAFVNSILNSGVTLEEFAAAAKDLLTGAEENGEKIRKFMYDHSNEIPRRHKNMMEMIAGQYLSSVDVSLGGKYTTLRNNLLRFGSSPVAIVDLLSAEPLWVAAYRRARLEGRDMGEAVYFADRAVGRAHGSSAETWRPGIMEGNQGKKWLASVYGFTNHIMNRQYEVAWQAKAATGAGGIGKAAAGSGVAAATAGLFAYYIFPGFIDEMVSPAKGTENEGWTASLARYIATSTTMGYVGARDLAYAIMHRHDPSFGLTNVPGEDVARLWRDLSKGEVAFDRAHAGKTLKHSISMFGDLTGLTNSAEGNLAEYLYNLHTGVEKPPKDMKELWRGVSKGTSNPPTGPDLIERALPGRVRRQP